MPSNLRVTHEDAGNHGEKIAVLESRVEEITRQMELLQNDYRDLRKWQYTVMGMGSTILGLMGWFGLDVIKRILGK